MRVCRRRNVRFETYHSDYNARDIVNVLLALGYEANGIWWACRMARGWRWRSCAYYPARLRSVILDSRCIRRKLTFIWTRTSTGSAPCEKSSTPAPPAHACDERYPQLDAAFYELYHRLNRQPLQSRFSPPGMDQELDIEISGYRLYDWLFSWLYTVRNIKKIPRLIYETGAGDAEDALRNGFFYDGLAISLSLGMHYTVQCQEEHISREERDYASVIAAYPHLSGYLNYQVEGSATLSRLCEMWRAKAQPMSANAPVKSDIPALLLSGQYDPITPAEYAAMAHEHLSAAYNFVLPHIGHGALRSHECAVAIGLAFIDAPLQEPDSGCIADIKPLAFE